jgi:hypothetical protein
MQFTQQEIDVLSRFENDLRVKGIELDPKHEGNFGILKGLLDNGYEGKITRENLEKVWAAALTIDDGLKFLPGKEAPDPRAAEKAKQERIRVKEERNKLGLGGMKTDYDKSPVAVKRGDVARKQDARTAEQIKLDEREQKAQASAAEQIGTTIQSYAVMGPGHIKHAQTAEHRAELRRISVKGLDGKQDHVETLKSVKRQILAFEQRKGQR